MGYIFDQVSFSYPGTNVFEDFSLNLKADGFVGIIGPNGCGKTTLIDLIMRLQKPQRGHITYLEKPLSSYSKKELARQIALVPQTYSINFPFLVKEVVMMGRYPHISRFSAPSTEDLAKVKEIMVQTGCIELACRPVTELSGGERQRVVFARALAQDTPVLLLDEATSNLDINHALGLLRIAADLVQSERNKPKRSPLLSAVATFPRLHFNPMIPLLPSSRKKLVTDISASLICT